jgi:hypothetical protein
MASLWCLPTCGASWVASFLRECAGGCGLSSAAIVSHLQGFPCRVLCHFFQPTVLYAADWLPQQDPRTNHAAAAVIKGKKYAANAWIHLYDFAKSNLWGCTGAFDYL